MNREDYVTEYIAELLRERGFNWECRTDYLKHPNGDIEFEEFDWWFNYSDEEMPLNKFLAPTLQMASKWCRVEKGYYIQIDYADKMGYYIIIHDANTGMELEDPIEGEDYFNAPEEAMTAALLWLLTEKIV